jgi:hypothetical protein
MIIESQNISMESHHSQRDRLVSIQQVQFRETTREDTPGVSLEISRQAMSRFARSTNLHTTVKMPLEDQALDDEDFQLTDKWRIAKYMLEKFFGVKVDIVKPGQNKEKQEASQHTPNPPPTPRTELRLDYMETSRHKETLSFHAKGGVTTADGRDIQFDANLEMSKETLQTITISLSANNPNMTDPLALNLDGKGVSLTGEKFQFDLDMDGEEESISFLEQGSGFLVLDKNQNNKVDDGGELFGPETGSGFLELQAYDNDNNRWIDENDAVFFNLNLWTKDGSGTDRLSTLLENNIGAIYLDRVATPFDLENGQLKETGIFLKENGEVNFVQEVDLRV